METNKKIEFKLKTRLNFIGIWVCSFLICMCVVQDCFSEGSGSKFMISGIVKDQATGNPLPGANVYILELKRGVVTDEEGKYLFRIPRGNYNIKVSFIGYTTEKRLLNVDGMTTCDFALLPNTQLQEVVVTSKRKDENLSKLNMGVQKLTANEIQKMPALMGEVDVIKALQLLPGVQSTSEGSSGFSVRGGSADQNLILLDDVNIYNASHMFGFFSVFNNDAVKSVELYKGNLPMKYGGRLSSLLDVKLKDHAPEKIKGTGGIGIISSRLTVEGPLGKNTSWLVSGRRSYADLFLKLSSDPDKRSETLYFYDVNAKISHRFSPSDKVSLNLYTGKDNFDSSFGSFNYGNSVASVYWNHLFSQNLLSRLSLDYTKYQYALQSSMANSKVKWASNIQDLTLRWNMDHEVSDKVKLEYGLSSTFHQFEPALVTRPDYPNYRMQRSYALEHSIYLGIDHKLNDRISLKYGLRATAFQNMGKASVYSYNKDYEVVDTTFYKKGKVYHTYLRYEPRFGAVYRLNSYSSVKANYTHNVQFVQIANSSASGSPLDLWFPASKNIKPQQADLYSVGYFRNFNNNAIEMSVELYYKRMNNVIDFVDNAQLLLNDKLEGEVRTGKGRAYGLEIMLKKNVGRLTGFVNYTLSRTERTVPGINDGKTYLSPTDKPHCVNLMLSYEFSKKWSFSAGWVYATGNPVTYPTGRMEINGEYFPIYSGRNTSRRSDYHRLDLSATYTPTKKPKNFLQGEWTFSVYNAYWHKNPWMISFDQNTSTGIPKAQMTYLFGAVPSITYNFKF